MPMTAVDAIAPATNWRRVTRFLVIGFSDLSVGVMDL
jgi:hypothetical protein